MTMMTAVRSRSIGYRYQHHREPEQLMNRKPLDPRTLLRFRGLVRKNVVAPLLDHWLQRRLDEHAARKKFVSNAERRGSAHD